MPPPEGELLIPPLLLPVPTDDPYSLVLRKEKVFNYIKAMLNAVKSQKGLNPVKLL